ncbi:hypothetical protein ACRTAI_002975 [Clostridium perfringens]
MKKLSIILGTIIMLLIGNVVTASATEIKTEKIQVTNIVIRANVPEKFDKDIEVNFNFKDGTNALYTLSNKDGYVYKGIIPVGIATLNFINVIPDDENFDITSPKTIVAEKDKTVDYSIDLKRSAVQKKKEFVNPRKNYDNTNYEENKNNGLNYKNDISKNPTTEKKDNQNQEDNQKQDSNKNEVSTKEEKPAEKPVENKEQEQIESEKKSSFWDFITKHILTITIFIVLAIACIYYKFFR